MESVNISSLNTAFKNISKNLSPKEIEILEKFGGMIAEPYDLINFFFETLMVNFQCGCSCYEHEYWAKLTIDEKDFLFPRIRKWYSIIIMIAPEYRNKFNYTADDEKKMEIVLKLERLSNIEMESYLQIEMIRAKRSSKIELKEWIEGEIEERRAIQSFKDTKINNDADNNYILIIPAHMVDRLLSEFNFFPDETPELWRKRFIDSPHKLEIEIKVEPEIKPGNNRHFLITLLSKLEDEKKVKVRSFSEYVENRWLKFSYRSTKSRAKSMEKFNRKDITLLNDILEIKKDKN